MATIDLDLDTAEVRAAIDRLGPRRLNALLAAEIVRGLRAALVTYTQRLPMRSGRLARRISIGRVRGNLVRVRVRVPYARFAHFREPVFGGRTVQDSLNGWLRDPAITLVLQRRVAVAVRGVLRGDFDR